MNSETRHRPDGMPWSKPLCCHCPLKILVANACWKGLSFAHGMSADGVNAGIARLLNIILHMHETRVRPLARAGSLYQGPGT